ncbi:hypothetical protein [Streptomyces sp. NPDC006285]|uniref:hypothetical protein n=1 Tax=Streptomyces sp. NPDC006285 TaxID=3364742 RepID=UPI003682061E
MGGVLRCLFGRLDDDPIDVGIGGFPGNAWPRVAAQAVQPSLDEAAPPGGTVPGAIRSPRGTSIIERPTAHSSTIRDRWASA